MSPIKPLRRFAHRLQRSQRGAVALTFLLVSAVMLMGTFGAIDLARYNIAENRLRDAVDATAISAAQALGAWDPAVASDKTAWQNYAGAFFNVNMPDSYLNSNVTANTIKAGIQYCTADPTGSITCPSQSVAGTPISAQYVNVTAQGRLPLLSTGFLKQASLPLSGNNQVIRRLKNNTEIVLALEDSKYTGSASNANIQAAAKGLVAAALGSMNLTQSSAAQGIRVGVVPFSAMVRMNTSTTGGGTPNAKDWVKAVATLLGVNTYVQNYWLGCIAEPYPPAPPPVNDGVSWGYWGANGNPQLPAAKRAPPDPTNTRDHNSFQPVFMPIPATSKHSGSPLGGFVNGTGNGNNTTITVTQLDNNDNPITGATTSIPLAQGNGNTTYYAYPRAPKAGLPPTVSDLMNYRFLGMDTNSGWGGLNPIVYSAFEPDSCAVVGKTQFLSQSVSTLNAAIDTMQGSPISESLIPGGLLWAWRMLAPEWSDDAVGTGRGWDDTQPGLPADPANTDITKPMVNGRAIVLVSTGTNSTLSDNGYRPAQMYNPTSPVQKSDFQMVVNYCNGGTTAPTPDKNGVIATGCSNGALLTGMVTSETSSIDSLTTVGNQAGGTKIPITALKIWPASSLVTLDMRNPAALVASISSFAMVGSKLVGNNIYSAFEDSTATIGWPAGTTTGLTAANAASYMQAVCTAIKNDSSSYPIRLYTVFVGGSGGTGQTNLGNCSSGPAYTFTNYNTNNLSSTFAAILGSMTELRLTK